MAYSAGSQLTAQLLNRLLVDHVQSATVATAETTTSTTYTDLATPGPAVTLTSAGNRALVVFEVQAFTNSAVQVGKYVSVAVSGATTIAASDAKSWRVTNDNTGAGQRSMGFAFFTINPGVNTYTLKYRLLTATSSTFAVRDIWVLAP